MNPMFAAGLFDSPWIVAAIVIIGAFVNWLSQLRQQKQQREEERRLRETEGDSPQKPQADFNVEEALRRLLGEETSPPTAAPPPIPRAVGVPPPTPVWRGNPNPPVLVPPPIVVARPVAVSIEISESDQATLHFEQLKEQGRHPAVAFGHGRRSRPSTQSALWRDRKSVRQAFVASLVFGPPKGMES